MLGPYRLVEELGTGGMGVVHLALDRGGRAVALKVLRAHVADDAEARTRLEREVATLSRITDPRVAPVIDADLTGSRPYIVTRFVPGPSLDELVGDNGPLDGPQLVRVARGLAGAIKSIHAAGVVHRDVKPSNVLLDDEGDPVLIDFGIAHLADDVRITVTGLVMGTPGYLSPEVINGGAVTAATDWWGWAATLAFAASGAPPFGGGAMDGVLSRVRLGEHDLSGVDPRLAPLLAAALTVDPAARPHADDVLAALERYAAGGDATVVIPGAVPRTMTQPVAPSSTRVLPTPVAPPAPPAPAPAPAPPAPPAPQYVPPPPAARVWPPPAPPASVVVPGPSLGQPPAPYVDPRIDRGGRRGTLLALAALLVALAAGWPTVAALAALLLRWAAAVADRVVTSLVLRRHARGVRSSDVALALLRAPWHLVVGAVATVLAAVLPAVVGVAAAFTVALASQLVSGSPSDPDRWLPLAGGMAAALLMGWIGPGGASLRRGARSIVRGAAPEGTGTTVAVGLCLALAALALASLALRHGVVHWWPLGRSPWATFLGR